MKFNVSRVIINLFLVLVAGGLLWYIVQSQNLLQNKQKQEAPKQTKVEVPFSEKSFSLDYKKFDPQLVENIALFIKGEKWVGSGFYDKDVYFEYPSSLYLAARERNKIISQRDVSLNLAKTLSFDLLVNFRSDSNDIELAYLIFTDVNGKTARYVLPKIDTGWQVITIPKEQFTPEANFNWAKITRVGFEITPRALARVIMNLGSLRGQPGSILQNDWNVKDERMVILDKRNNVISLLARNIGSSVATMKKITKATNFSFQSSFTPLNSSSAGLFFRGDHQTGQGYYLTVNGINGNQWQVSKVGKDGTKVLATGEIANFSFRSEEKYFLKVETKANNIKAYFSLDNVNYTLLADVFDEEFNSGGVGVAVGNAGATLFNDFEFKQ